MTSTISTTGRRITECRDCHASDVVSLERTRFFPRQLVAAADLTQDQVYFREKLRRHNRLLHGWGIVCGAEVHVDGECTATVSPGYVLGPYGDEIVIEPECSIDACKQDSVGTLDCMDRDPWCRDTPHIEDGATLFLAVRYVERATRPVRVPGCGCGCDESECEYSRTCDGFELKVLTELPSSYRDRLATAVSDWDATHACTSRGRACPACPAEPWVVLADLEINGGSIVRPVGVTNRRYVASFGNYGFTCPQPAPGAPA